MWEHAEVSLMGFANSLQGKDYMMQIKCKRVFELHCAENLTASLHLNMQSGQGCLVTVACNHKQEHCQKSGPVGQKCSLLLCLPTISFSYQLISSKFTLMFYPLTKSLLLLTHSIHSCWVPSSECTMFCGSDKYLALQNYYHCLSIFFSFSKKRRTQRHCSCNNVTQRHFLKLVQR